MTGPRAQGGLPTSPMTMSDSHHACAALVHKGDPDRFLAVMAAPPAKRPGLFALYAFNLEIARAPWITQEPLLAQMRLQFWRDVVSGEGPPTHEIAPALMTLKADMGLDPALLAAMIDAREVEIGTKAPFETADHLWRYLEDSAGGVLMLAVQALGGGTPESWPAVRDLGAAQGLANYLLAVPALENAGRMPLPDGRAQAVAALAQDGLTRLKRARAGLGAVPKAARPALLAAWQAKPLLAQAVRDPGRVADGRLAMSEFRRRGGLLLASLTGP